MYRFKNKNFILISAPGSGKGSFSQYFAKNFGYTQVGSGDLLRTEVKNQTLLGKKIQPILDSGQYIDEDLVWKILANKLLECINNNKQFVLDGFPRSFYSLDLLKNFMKKYNFEDSVIFLQFLASDETCIDRVVYRQICQNCFYVYNLKFSPPKIKNLCDYCHSELSERTTDSEDIIKSRLKFFHETIEPIIKFIEKDYPVIKIDTEVSLDLLEKKYNDQFKKFAEKN